MNARPHAIAALASLSLLGCSSGGGGDWGYGLVFALTTAPTYAPSRITTNPDFLDEFSGAFNFFRANHAALGQEVASGRVGEQWLVLSKKMRVAEAQQFLDKVRPKYRTIFTFTPKSQDYEYRLAFRELGFIAKPFQSEPRRRR